MAERKCPECGERLSRDARACACGWGAKSKKDFGPKHDMVCQWVSSGLRCRYPVGMFPEGATKGFCIFHRATPSGPESAKIADESHTGTREQYLERAKALVYGVGDNWNVRHLRAKLIPIDPSSDSFSKYLPAMREPGADESGAAE